MDISGMQTWLWYFPHLKFPSSVLWHRTHLPPGHSGPFPLRGSAWCLPWCLALFWWHPNHSLMKHLQVSQDGTFFCAILLRLLCSLSSRACFVLPTQVALAQWPVHCFLVFSAPQNCNFDLFHGRSLMTGKNHGFLNQLRVCYTVYVWYLLE